MSEGDGTGGSASSQGACFVSAWDISPMVVVGLLLAGAVLTVVWLGRRSWSARAWNDVVVQSLPVVFPLAAVALVVPMLSRDCDWWTDPLGRAEVLFSGGLITLLGVAAIYRRRRSGSDIARIDRLAFAFRLGGTFALLPFLRHGATMPGPDAALTEYRDALEEPDFVQMPWVWAFVLCTATVFLVSWTFMFELHLVSGRLNTPLLGGMQLLRDVVVPTGQVEPDARYWRDPLSVETIRYMTRGLLWIDLAFLGAYLWSIIYLVWRMAVLDLTGHAFNMITVRIVASAILAILFHHLYWAIPAEAGASTEPAAAQAAPPVAPEPSSTSTGATSRTPPITGDAAATSSASVGMPSRTAPVPAGSAPVEEPGALGGLDLWLLVPIACGLMPERVLRKLSDLARSTLALGSGGVSMPLEDIDGIDDRYRVRLAEIGIDDAHALAAANPIRVTMVTPFALPQIVAWIDQAILMAHVGPEPFRALRDRGIRNASSLLRRAELPSLPTGSGASVDLEAIQGDILADPCWRRLAQIIDRFPGIPVSPNCSLRNGPDDA